MTTCVTRLSAPIAGWDDVVLIALSEVPRGSGAFTEPLRDDEQRGTTAVPSQSSYCAPSVYRLLTNCLLSLY